MTEFPTTRRRVAQAAYDDATAAWRVLTRDALAAMPSDLIVAAAGDPAAIAVIREHAPVWADDSVRCFLCIDPDDRACGDPGCCGPPESLPFPCEPLRDALAPYGVNPADDLPPRPVWEAFYREPDVTITLAHPIRANGRFYGPRDEVALPLSTARTLRARMTPDSWNNVERLASQ